METERTVFCSACSRDLSMDQFYHRKKHGYTIIHPCKQCNIAKAVKWAKENRARRRITTLKYDSAHRGRNREYSRRHRAKKSIEERRAPHLMRFYKMTNAEYAALLLKQGGVCALCPATQARSTGGFLCVDHDHKTGRVRGLLCHSCNTAIGFFEDNPERLMKAMDYLKDTDNALSRMLAGA